MIPMRARQTDSRRQPTIKTNIMIDICPMEKGEVFHEHVAPVYTENGIAKFLGMLSPEGLSDMQNEERSFVILAKDQSEIVGMLSVINDNHIALIFIDPANQRKGIGKNLINAAIKKCYNRCPKLSEITVSSSPNSKIFYESAGFKVQGSEVDEDGMRFIPMRKIVVVESANKAN